MSQKDGMPNHRFVVMPSKVVMTLRRAAGRGFRDRVACPHAGARTPLGLTLVGSARADVVTDWVAVAERSHRGS